MSRPFLFRQFFGHSKSSEKIFNSSGARTRSMFILAIDTALDYCAAAVLDTNSQAVIAQEIAGDETRPRRGADAPDCARDDGFRHRLSRPRPRRGHHRPWQLHRIACWPLSRARHRTCRRQARGGPDDAVRLCRSAGCRRTGTSRSSRRSMRATTMFTFRLLPATAQR